MRPEGFVFCFAARLALAATTLDMIRAGGAQEGDVKAAARAWCLCNDRVDYRALKNALLERDGVAA
jgi:hypothetical protein